MTRSEVNKRGWRYARVRNAMIVSFIAGALWVGSPTTVKAQVGSPMAGGAQAGQPQSVPNVDFRQAGDNLSMGASDPLGNVEGCGNSGRPGCPPKRCPPNGNPQGTNPNPGNPNCRGKKSHDMDHDHDMD